MTRQYGRRVVGTRAVVLLLAVAFLELAPRLGMVDTMTLVPLSEMLAELVGALVSGEIVPHLLSTAGMIVLGFALAAVSGVAVGYLLWRYTALHRALDPYLTSYYALPVFAFYPVLVAIFGLNRTPVVLLAWAYAAVAVITSAVIGFNSVRAVHMKAARVYHLGAWQVFTRVQLPSAAPHVFTGLKLAVTYSVIGVIASEFILATQGLGWLVSYNYNSFALADMYASILLVVGLAVLVTSAVGLLERRVWSTQEGG